MPRRMFRRGAFQNRSLFHEQAADLPVRPVDCCRFLRGDGPRYRRHRRCAKRTGRLGERAGCERGRQRIGRPEHARWRRHDAPRRRPPTARRTSAPRPVRRQTPQPAPRPRPTSKSKQGSHAKAKSKKGESKDGVTPLGASAGAGPGRRYQDPVVDRYPSARRPAGAGAVPSRPPRPRPGRRTRDASPERALRARSAALHVLWRAGRPIWRSAARLPWRVMSA